MTMPPADTPEPLTPLERELIKHVERGESLDLGEHHPADETAMRAWGETRTIRAWVVRDVLRGRLAPDPDPHGLQVRGVRIAGRVDLDNITTTVSLTLNNCLLDEGMTADSSHLANLALSRCWLEHPTETPLSGARLVASGLALDGATVVAHSADGAVHLIDAQIDQLSCNGATLRNNSGPALHADRLQTNGNVLLRNGFSATGDSDRGAVRLLGARIGGGLVCHGATLRNSSGPALHADGLQTNGDVFLREGFSATGDGDNGAVRLLGARIGGGLVCHGATLRNNSGPALVADRLQTNESVLLRNGFSATGDSDRGAVRLLSARIGGQLGCRAATLRNNSGPALVADGLQTNGDMFMCEGFSATGTGDNGAVRLLSARIGGQLDCSGATTLRNNSGPALHADRLQTNGNVFLRDGFSATGDGDEGAVRLLGARIGGQLGCRYATLRNNSGPALHAYALQVSGEVFLREGFSATGGGKGAAINLAGVQIGGTLTFTPNRLEHLSSALSRLDVDGLVYNGLPSGISTYSWLRLLREATPAYVAQPYQQLAAALRAAGHDHEARRVLIQQRRDQIQRHALTGRTERTWARITGLTLGYGYQPWRALLGLLAALITAAVITAILGAHGGLAQIHTPPNPTPTDCTLIERIGVGLDLGTPLISTGARTHCDTTNTATGQWLTATGWALRLLAWAFATLFIAGFTGAVRKT
ncbi:hypothetical protein [Amycolatopsis sp. NPDC003676]